MVGNVMILGKQSPSDGEHPGDLLESGPPIGHMVQDCKVEDCIELSVLVRKCGDIARFYIDSAFAVAGQSLLRSLNHLRIEVTCSESETLPESSSLTGHTFTRSTTNIENFETFSVRRFLD